MSYFENISNLDELKKAYHKLAMIHHPDRGGDPEVMKAIIEEHDKLFAVLRDKQNETADEQHQTTEAPEEFRDMVSTLLNMDGLEVELCGCWLWIGGNTKEHKEELKAAGCRWSAGKKLWYWHHVEAGSRYHRGKKTIQQIRSKYGSQTFKSSESGRNKITD